MWKSLSEQEFHSGIHGNSSARRKTDVYIMKNPLICMVANEGNAVEIEQTMSITH